MSVYARMEFHDLDIIEAVALGLPYLRLTWSRLTLSTLLAAIDPDTDAQRRLVQCALDSLKKKRQRIEERRIECVAPEADRLERDLMRYCMAQALLSLWLREQDLTSPNA